LAQILEEVSQHTVTRRDFVKTATVVASAAAVLPHLSLGQSLFKKISAEEAAKLQAASSQLQSFTYVLGFCAPAQGAPALVIDAQNGRIIRIRPLHFDWQYKLTDFNYTNWSITAGNGVTFTPFTKTLVPPYHLAYKKRVYSPNRVQYPFQRVDWAPGGGATTNYNPQNRGKSQFVRITWDQAISTIVSEIKRINSTYGSYAIYALEEMVHGEAKTVHARGGNVPLLNTVVGGVVVEDRDPDSWEGWFFGAKHMWGQDLGQGILADLTNVLVNVLENSGLCIFVGCDPEATSWGWTGQMPGVYCFWLKQAGKHVVYITPGLNWGAAVHADKWIPVLPNTDIAWQLAVAYTWITEGTYNTEYVATHTFGFDDADLLPIGVPAGTSFYSYVMGQGPDGIPKTPKWAEGICGIPSKIIKALAREWAAKPTSTFHGNGGGYIRGPYSTEPARGEVALLAMQGVGAPGRVMCKMVEWGLFGASPLPAGEYFPSANGAMYFPGLNSPTTGPGGVTNALIQRCMVARSILNPPITFYCPNSIMAPAQAQFVPSTYPAKGNPEIHMIWANSTDYIGDEVGGYQLIEAYRSPKIEFFLVQVPWFENECMYADMILPITTIVEDDIDFNVDIINGAFSTVLLQNQVIQPIGESISDVEVMEQLANAFDSTGALLKTLESGMSHQQMVQNGFNISGAQNAISWADLQAKQYYVVPCSATWSTHVPQISQYYQSTTPSSTKVVATKSGLIEFYCQWLAGFNKTLPGGDDPERPAVLHYIPYGPSHQESMVCARAQTYPLLAVTAHPRWRVHTEMDDISWTREIETMKVRGPDGYQYECIWLNPVDAAARGIKSGDIVQIFNERGTVLGGAYVTERIMQGAIWMDHGSRADLIVDDIPVSGVEVDGMTVTQVGIDRGGSNNIVSPYTTTSQYANGGAYNSYLVQVSKADMASLQAQYPAAFARPFDPDVGPINTINRVTTASPSEAKA
jgi:trimethylamine-N-oxide reductase (cytochrome c)